MLIVVIKTQKGRAKKKINENFLKLEFNQLRTFLTGLLAERLHIESIRRLGATSFRNSGIHDDEHERFHNPKHRLQPERDEGSQTERERRGIFFEFFVRVNHDSLSVVFILKHLPIYIRRPEMIFVQIDLFVRPAFN